MARDYELRKERDGKPFRDQIVQMVMARKNASEKNSEARRKKFPMWYDMWRGFNRTRYNTGSKHDIHIPLTFSTIQADVARKMGTHFSQAPYIQFAGFGPDDAPLRVRTPP